MRRFFASMIIAAGALAVGVLTAPAANAGATVLVAQCIFEAPCWTGDDGATPFSDTVTGAQLDALGLGTTQAFSTAQVSYYTVQLGPTTFTFDTSGGPVVDVVGDFTSGTHDPCTPFCEVDTVAEIAIPDDATGLTVTGSWGGNGVGSSAAADLFLGVVPVPEPAAWALMLIGFGAIGAQLRRRPSRAATV